MDYYDGNTVTGLWNLAQHYTLNDNSYNTQFGPSTPGALNVISGQTHGATAVGGTSPDDHQRHDERRHRPDVRRVLQRLGRAGHAEHRHRHDDGHQHR